jgi:hypothetical protein
MPFEFEKTSVPVETDCVPAEIANGVSGGTVGTVYDAVTVCPSTPNEIPFELLNTTSPVVIRVVPADRDWRAGCIVCAGKLALAVTLELPDIPNVTLFEFEKTTVPELTL